MKKTIFQKHILYQIFVILFAFSSAGTLSLFVNPTYVGWFIKIAQIVVFFYFFQEFNKLDIKPAQLYIIVMSVGCFLHLIYPPEIEVDPIWEYFKWTSLVISLCLSLKFRICNWVLIAFFGFYCIECFMSIYERITLTNLIDFSRGNANSELNFRLAQDYLANGENTFRSCALLGHGLINANVVSICMAFILCSSLKNNIKWILMIVGIGALWGFNSRAAIGIWMLILFYRIFLYHKKAIFILVSLIAALFILPPVIQYVASTGVLGRFDFNFSDDSSETRWLAFVWFGAQNWTIERIFTGGLYICMPGSDLPLENGVLVALGYWGWIVGSFKVILEIIISYILLPKSINFQNRIIIMLSCWGVAMGNNNILNTYVLCFFILAFVAYFTHENLIHNK